MSDYEDLIETELDEEVTEAFSAKIEKAINGVIKKFPNADSRVELMTVLLSFAAQVSQDIGIIKTDFGTLSKAIYNETLDGSVEAETDEDGEYSYEYEDESYENVESMVYGITTKKHKHNLN